MGPNLLALAVFGAAAAFLLRPGVRLAPAWRATVTPLASIIGSGFLISLPLLSADLGIGAIAAMAGLLLFAYLVGAAIRFNIAWGEPLFASGSPYVALRWLERASHLVLSCAYFISVVYYLTLLAAFFVKASGLASPLAAPLITTGGLAFIGLYGLFRGLHGLESVEEYAVSIKLGVIAALLAGLVWLNIDRWTSGGWQIRASEPHVTWHAVRVALGMLIIVQGFETSRFLGIAYSPGMRIRTMRWAQLSTAAIYLAFFGLAAITIPPAPAGNDVAAIIDQMAIVAAVMPLMLTGGAIFAQLSASVADAIGAAGLIFEVSDRRIAHRNAYPVIALVGILLTWSVNVFGIIALASRAFAMFYAMQCVVAAAVALASPPRRRWLLAAGFLLLAVGSAAVTLTGLPAAAG